MNGRAPSRSAQHAWSADRSTPVHSPSIAAISSAVAGSQSKPGGDLGQESLVGGHVHVRPERRHAGPDVERHRPRIVRRERRPRPAVAKELRQEPAPDPSPEERPIDEQVGEIDGAAGVDRATEPDDPGVELGDERLTPSELLAKMRDADTGTKRRRVRDGVVPVHQGIDRRDVVVGRRPDDRIESRGRRVAHFAIADLDRTGP